MLNKASENLSETKTLVQKLYNSNIFSQNTNLSLVEVVGVLPVELVLVANGQTVHVGVHGTRVELASSGVSSGGALDLLAHVGRLTVELGDDVAVSVLLVLVAGGTLVHVVASDDAHGAHEDHAADDGGEPGDVLRELFQRESDVGLGGGLGLRDGVAERLVPRLAGRDAVPGVVSEGASRDERGAEARDGVVAGGGDSDTRQHLGSFFCF